MGLTTTRFFSPVVDFSILRFFIVVLVSILGWAHVQVDVKCAYLYGKLEEKVYMRQPKGYMMPGSESKVCLLHRAIYGLHQSSRQWNYELDTILCELGFKRLQWCNCVYVCQGNVVLLVYVDDLLIFGKKDSLISQILRSIETKLEIVNLGKIRLMLGVQFEQRGNKLVLHQRKYIDSLEDRFTDIPRTYPSVPMKVGLAMPKARITAEGDSPANCEKMGSYPYRTLIGCLSYVANRSRPDIAYAVNALSQFNNSHTYEHWLMVCEILNYLFNTRDYGINLSNVNQDVLVGYSDASWGSNVQDRSSTSGTMIFLGNIPIYWKARKQRCIALSTMESEFVALTECVKELVWLSNILDEVDFLGYDRRKPILFCDNQAAIYFAKNSLENAKTKHIDIRYHFVRKLINEERFTLKYIQTQRNLADILTKAMVKEKHQQFIQLVFETQRT